MSVPNLSTEKPSALGLKVCEQYFVPFENALSKETCQILSKRVLNLLASGDLLKCEQCSDSLWAYDDPLFVEVHEFLQIHLSELLGINLLKSFSSVRYYPKGEILEKHIDREAAELVLSLTIDFKGNQKWPIYLEAESINSPTHKIQLGIGDAVLFRGCKLFHWREPLENEWQIQAFFFFVDAEGQYKEHAGDMINKYKELS